MYAHLTLDSYMNIVISWETKFKLGSGFCFVKTDPLLLSKMIFNVQMNEDTAEKLTQRVAS